MSDAESTEAKPASRSATSPARWRESEILDWIRRLTHEKDRLRRSHQGRPLASADVEKLREVETTLDQSWDLVRQRRARRAAGKSWDDLSQRVAELVKGYRH